MKLELQEKLYTDFPKLFRYFKEKTSPIQPMAFGFECGDGWYKIIHRTAKMIQAHVDKSGDEQVLAVQVKEKFGGLRFYIDGGSEKAYDIIDFFESLSYIICEECGESTATTETKNGWIRTRCASCWGKKDS